MIQRAHFRFNKFSLIRVSNCSCPISQYHSSHAQLEHEKNTERAWKPTANCKPVQLQNNN